MTEAWFNTFDLKAGDGGWQVVVFADGALVGERSLVGRRLVAAGWKKDLYMAGVRLAGACRVRLGEAVVVAVAAGCVPRLEVVDAEGFPPGDDESLSRPLFPAVPITGRLERIVAELEEIGVMGYELGDVVGGLCELIGLGEPGIAPLP